jgi:arylsulfatase A-like enzyme
MSTGRDESEATLDPYPGVGRFRRDRTTAQRALAHLAHAGPDFLFLGLGEPDEFAHRGDYSGYIGSIRGADRVIGELVTTLAGMGARGEHTTVFVTSDHGRAKAFREHGGAYPESARVWLVAFGGAIRTRGALGTPAPHRLADLAPTARVILGLPTLVPAARPAAEGTPLVELF